jgi:hypothetical protein
MCANCEQARGPIVAEVARRTGIEVGTVDTILRTLEEMTIEADEIRERREQEAKEAIAAALSGNREQAIEGLRKLFGGNAEVHMVEIGPDGVNLDRAGFPAPVPAHEKDVGEPRLPGMYL